MRYQKLWKRILSTGVAGILIAQSMSITALTALAAEPEPPKYPYLDTSLSFEERAADLVSRMTPDEKYAQLYNGRSPNAPAIPRLGVDEYQWWSEALHGVARDGTATSFPTGLGIASTWDPDLVQEMMSMTSDEIREKFNTDPRNGWHGLSYWSPTINLARDPRWGRAEESYGEDPFLTSQIANGFVRGLQGEGEDETYLKSIATVKHFMANNSESNRHSGSSDFDERTLREYYGYAFQSAVEDAGVESIMTSYNRVNGIPSTVNLHMLDDLLRRTWGFDGYVVTDCDTLSDVINNHPWRPDSEGLEWGNEWNELPDGWEAWAQNKTWGGKEATALALMSGMDANCGNTAGNNAKAAIDAGLMSEDDVDVALVRLFTARMRTGEFDPDGGAYGGEGFQKGEQIHASDHQQLAEDSSDQAVVLLKNEPAKGQTSPILPLDGASIGELVVVGELANKVILGDYSTYEPQHTSTPLAGIQAAWQRASGNSKATVTYISGVQSSSGNYLMNIKDPQLYDAGGNLVRSVDWHNNSGIKGCQVEGAGNIGYNGKSVNWVKFDSVDFTGVKTIKIDMAGDSNACPTTVEVRIGSPEGQVITKMTQGKGSTGGWGNYVTYPFDSAIDGGYDTKQQDVYFVFKETLADSSFSAQEQAAIKGADAVIAYVGTKEGQNGYQENSDGTNLDLPNGQSKMVQDVLALNPNTAVYIQAVSQINVEPFKDQAPAILWCTYNGQAQGNAAGRLLFGERNPSGKLPFTWYTDIEQLDDVKSYAIRPSDPNAPEGSLGRTYQYFTGGVSYPFGHGLSYSDLQYSGLSLSKRSVTPDETITVAFDVKNNSKVDGAEAAQVYVISPNADRVDRPAKQLKGFDKQTIPAGETVHFSIDIPVEDLFYWDEAAGRQSYDQGVYTIEVGSSSGDVRGSDFFNLRGQLTPSLKTVTAIPTGHILNVDGEEKISTKLSATRNDQTFVDLDAGGVSVVYSSSRPGVAAVDQSGVVTAVGGGTATITATVTENGVTRTDSFPVAVHEAVEAESIYLDGQALAGFQPGISSYTVEIASLDHIPFVTAKAVEGNTVSVTQATRETLQAAVRVEHGLAYSTYLIDFKYTQPPEPPTPIAPTDFTQLTGKEDLAAAGWSIREEAGTSLGEDSDSWRIDSSGLTITMKNGDLYNNTNTAKNLFVQDAPEGDWIVETEIHMTAEPTKNYEQAGIMAYQDAGNYLKLNYQKGHVEINSEIGGKFSDTAAAKLPFTGTDLWLRLEKTGSTYTGWCSSDGATYTKVGSKEHPIGDLKIGLLSNTGTGTVNDGDIDATFKYVKSPDTTPDVNSDHDVTVHTKGASATYTASEPGRFAGQVADDATLAFTIAPDAGRALTEENITVAGTTGSVTKEQDVDTGVWTVTVPNVKSDITLEAFVPNALPIVTAISPVAPISVPYGTPAAAVKLPVRVSLALSDGTEADNVRVTWQCDAYRADKAGEYLFTAPLPQDPRYENAGQIAAVCRVTVEPQPTCPVTVTGGTLPDGKTSGSFAEGVSVTVTADQNTASGKRFLRWEAVGVSLPDPSADPVTFTMPTQPVSLTASFQEAALAQSIELDGKPLQGFAPGKLDYQVKIWDSALPKVSAEAEGDVEIVQATEKRPVATITVTEDGVTRVYTLTFTFMPTTERASNPYLPLWEHIPDGEPHVFQSPIEGEGLRVYIYGSHDSSRTGYCGPEYVTWSAPVEDLTQWRYEGQIYSCSDASGGAVGNATLFAPDVGYKDGTYYLYVHDWGHSQSIRVATSESPAGPFTYKNEGGHDAAVMVGDTSKVDFDPAVFVDDDGRAYAYWGASSRVVGFSSGELEPDMKTIKKGTQTSSNIDMDFSSNCGVQEGPFDFFEAASVRKVDGTYVLVYSQKVPMGTDDGVVNGDYRGRLAYAYSDKPLGPWTYGGVIIDNGGELVKPGVLSYDDGNNHGGIVQADGQWYVFYHRMTQNNESARQGMLEPISVTVTADGRVIIPQVEMTSQGADTDGLDAYSQLEAGLACYLTGGGYITSGYQEDPDHNPIVQLKSGSVAGYKYLDFGSGAGTDEFLELQMDLQPKGTAGQIDIYIDKPNTQEGTLIGSLSISDEAGEYETVHAGMSNVTGKHAVYFVFSGVGSGEICALNKFRFAKTEAMFADDFTGGLEQWRITGEPVLGDGSVTLSDGDVLVSAAGSQWRDYAVTAVVEQGDAALWFRMSDAKDFYALRTEDDAVILTSTVNGIQREIARRAFIGRQPLELQVKVCGEEIQVLIDGTTVLVAADDSHRLGGIALTGADAEISYVQVRPNEEPSGLILEQIFLDGEELSEFDQSVEQYTIPVDGTEIPQVTATTSDGATHISIAQAKGIPGNATVKFVGQDETRTYTIAFFDVNAEAELHDFKSLDGLPDGWEIVNPQEEGTNISFSEHGLVIHTTGKDGLDIENQIGLSDPLVGDWTVETHFTLSDPIDQNWQKYGIYVVLDENDYICAWLEHNDKEVLQLMWNGQNSGSKAYPEQVTDLYLRLVKTGTRIELYYTLPEDEEQYLGGMTIDDSFDAGAALQLFASSQKEGNDSFDATIEYCSILQTGYVPGPDADQEALEALALAIGDSITVPAGDYTDADAIAEAALDQLEAREDLDGAEVALESVYDHFVLTLTKGSASCIKDPFPIAIEASADDLWDLYEEAQALGEADYTAASWERLTYAMERAYALGNDASPYEIATAYSRLQTAVDGLTAAYAVTVDPSILNGTVRVDPSRAAEGDTVTITVSPDADYQLAEGSLRAYLTGDDTTTVPLTGNTFLMPGAAVTVTAAFVTVPVAGVSVEPKEVTLYSDADPSTVTLNAILEPANASDRDVAWSSSDESVATVDPATGLVTAVGNGKAVITVTTADGGLTDTCTITVTAAPVTVPVTGVTLEPKEAELYSNADPRTVALNAILEPADATNRDVAWSSSDGSVATVDPVTGLVTAVGNGKAVITATTADGGLTDTCAVTVSTYSSGGGGGGSSSSNTGTKTEKNPDGSTTKTVTDKKTGAVTETTTWPNGDKTVTETRKDGTVTETVKRKDGFQSERTTTADGETTAEIVLPEKPVDTVVLPLPPVTAGRNKIAVKAEGPAVIVIPVEDPGPATVAVIVHEDGAEEIVKTSVLTEDGLAVTIPGNVTVKVIDNAKTFADVAETHWAHEAVTFATSRALFNGTGEDHFDPSVPMSRAMLVTVLARLDGQDVAGGDTWYEKAATWGVDQGITDGTSLDAGITRESLAVMLWRYDGQPAAEGEGKTFPDSGDVSDWAADAMDWAVTAGILSGKDGDLLDPAGSATRAEVATMLMRFLSR